MNSRKKERSEEEKTKKKKQKKKKAEKNKKKESHMDHAFDCKDVVRHVKQHKLLSVSRYNAVIIGFMLVTISESGH